MSGLGVSLAGVALAALGVFLIVVNRRRSEVFEALPYLLFLLCPALHLLLHGGHGAHQHVEEHAAPARAKADHP